MAKKTPIKEEHKQSKTQSSLASQFNGGFASLLQQENGTFRATPQQLRNLAKANPFVSVAINKIKQRVAKVNYIIKPKDPLDQTNYDTEISYLKDLLAIPNQQDDTYRTLITKLIDDMLVLDMGVIEEVRNARGEIVELYNVDGATIVEKRDEYGYFESPAYLQFMPYNMGSTPDATFELNELMIFQVNPSTYGTPGVGRSPVEMVLSTVVSGISALLYNTSQFSNSALPPAIINLKGVGSDEIKQFKFGFEQQLMGKPWSNAYTNAEDLSVELLRPSNQDMQFYELNLWLARIVITAFDLTPQDFGLTMDVNRSTAESQDKMSRDGSVATYLDVIKEEINTDLIADLALINPKFGNLIMDYELSTNLEALKTQTSIDKENVLMGTRTVNELRLRDGLEPLAEMKQELEGMQETGNKEEVKEEKDDTKKRLIEKAQKLISFYG